MKHAPLIAALLCVLCALPLAAQPITVAHPGTADTCIRGQACAIAWTLTPPGQTGNVSIDLINKSTPTVVKNIAPSVPIGNLQFSWTVPADVATDKQYRVRVQGVLSGLQVSDIGDPFWIKAQSGGFHPQPGQVAAKSAAALQAGQGVATVAPIHVVFPVAGDTWNIGKVYTVKWTSSLPADDAFDVDLCDASGNKVHQMYHGAGTAQRSADGSYSVQANIDCHQPDGKYKVRVTDWGYQKSGSSGVINGIVKTKKIIQSIPVSWENGLITSTNRSNVNYAAYCCGLVNFPNKARVGHYYDHTINPSLNYDRYEAEFMRARLTVDLSALANKKGHVESATLIFGDHQRCSNCGTSPHLFCFGNLFALSYGQVDKWNTLQPGWSVEPYHLTGWSSPINPAAGVDIKVPVQEWLDKTKGNFGFVVTGSAEFIQCTESCRYECVSFFHPIMYVTFIEKPDPCNP